MMELFLLVDLQATLIVAQLELYRIFIQYILYYLSCTMEVQRSEKPMMSVQKKYPVSTKPKTVVKSILVCIYVCCCNWVDTSQRKTDIVKVRTKCVTVFRQQVSIISKMFQDLFVKSRTVGPSLEINLKVRAKKIDNS